jgi:DNA replication protein DnaC
MFGFGRAKKEPTTMLIDLIEHNADQIVANERKDRSEATYLAICLVIDDLMARPDGQSGYQTVMGLLQTRYVQHMNDVITYIAWSTGRITLTPEADAAMARRHA